MLLLIVPGVQAQQGDATPADFWYFLDVFWDDMQLMFTADPTAKAKLGLDIADERLEEFRMTAEHNPTAAAAAQREHSKVLSIVSQSVDLIDRTDGDQEIEEVKEIETQLIEHEVAATEIETELKIRVEVEGDLSPEQRALLEEVIATLRSGIDDVELSVKSKEDEAKVKIKSQTGETDEELELRIKKLEEEKGLHAAKNVKAERVIADARTWIEKVSGVVTDADQQANRLLANAIHHLEDAVAAFDSGDYGKAFGQATAARELAENAYKHLGKNQDDDEIFFETVDLECMGRGGDLEWVIRSQDEYKAAIDASPDMDPDHPNSACQDYEFPTFDFEDVTLIGKATMASGCSREFERKVTKDDEDKKVVYKIGIIQYGTCEPAFLSNNWIVIDRIPDDYQVFFKVNSRYSDKKHDEPDVDYFSCEEDSDCVAVNKGCCGCTAGGQAKAINKDLVDEWEKILGEECAAVACAEVISDHWTCTAPVECLENTCTLVSGSSPSAISGYDGDTDEETCEADGGLWGIWGNAPDTAQSCNPPTEDADEACLDSSECSSYCEAPEEVADGDDAVGSCYGWEHANCMKEMNDGLIQAEWCL